MRKSLCTYVFACLLCLLPAMAEARVMPALVPHPVTIPAASRTPGLWRSQSGAWGEQLVDQSLKLRGFQVREIKLPGNHGIDRIAIRRARNGTILDLKFVEVKTHRGSTPRLGQTRHGQQMSRKWLADHIKALRRTANAADRDLARDISRFVKASGRPITHFGELHDLNTRTGRYTIRQPRTLAVVADDSIERYLVRIGRRGSAAVRQWAMSSLADYTVIRATRMTAWLTPIQQSRMHAMARLVAGPVRIIVLPLGKLPLGRFLDRAAGPLAIVVITAWEAYEIAHLYGDYRAGRLDYRGFVRQASRVGGGALGALGGATGGMVTGMWLGTFGGPVAWITVPAGGFVGGAIGGVFGYFAGSTIAGTAADWYLTSLDAESQRQLDEKLLVLSWSELDRLREATLR